MPVALNPFGPLQLYDISEPAPDAAPAVSVKVPPGHKELADDVRLATVGIAFTVTADVITDTPVAHPTPG